MTPVNLNCRLSIAQNSLNSTRNLASCLDPTCCQYTSMQLLAERAPCWIVHGRSAVTVWESFFEIKCNYVGCGSVQLYTGLCTAVHSCRSTVYSCIVSTAVGTSHFHCTKCPQLWSDKFRPWSISVGGTPQSVLLYNGCHRMSTQTEFSDLL